jgi:hypothetical protein
MTSVTALAATGSQAGGAVVASGEASGPVERVVVTGRA